MTAVPVDSSQLRPKKLLVFAAQRMMPVVSDEQAGTS